MKKMNCFWNLEIDTFNILITNILDKKFNIYISNIFITQKMINVLGSSEL